MSKVLEKTASTSQEVDQSVIDRAVAAALVPAIEGILSKLNLNQAAPAQKDSEFSARDLASELKKMSGHVDGKIHVDPEIMEKQYQAKKEMGLLLADLKSKRGTVHERKPLYKVISDTYFGGRLYNDSRRDPLCWYGEPNEAVLPMNETARQVYELFKASVSLPADPIPSSEVSDSENGVVRYKDAARIQEQSLLEDNSVPNMSAIDLKDLVVPSDLLDDGPQSAFYPNGFSADRSHQYASR